MPTTENPTKRRLPIPKSARIKTYYDTQPVKQNEADINFFPATADKKVTRNNYVQNPFPGDATRRIAGLSFEVLQQFIDDDSANGIDSRAIANALKYGGVILTADQSYTQFLRAPIGEYSNFSQAQFVKSADSATSVLKSAGMYRLDDPFDVAPNQNLNLSVHFNDASAFPTATQWDDSSQQQLQLRATLYLAVIDHS